MTSVEPRSSGAEYWRELEQLIRNGRHDPDFWLNPETDQVEVRERRINIDTGADT